MTYFHIEVNIYYRIYKINKIMETQINTAMLNGLIIGTVITVIIIISIFYKYSKEDKGNSKIK